MKKVFGIIGGVAALGAIIAFKFLAPSAEVSLKNATGAGWDDARAELQSEIDKVMNTQYTVFDLAEADKTKIATCIVDKSIAFLNNTDCSYLYNTATTSEQEHLAAQEKCMNKVKFEQHQEGYTLECLKQHMPDSWKTMKKIFVGVYEDTYVAQGLPAAESKKVAECISGKLVTLWDGRKYKLINQDATTAEDLLIAIDKYIPDFDADKEVTAILTECAPTGDVTESQEGAAGDADGDAAPQE